MPLIDRPPVDYALAAEVGAERQFFADQHRLENCWYIDAARNETALKIHQYGAAGEVGFCRWHGLDVYRGEPPAEGVLYPVAGRLCHISSTPYGAGRLMHNWARIADRTPADVYVLAVLYPRYVDFVGYATGLEVYTAPLMAAKGGPARVLEQSALRRFRVDR